MRPVIKRLEQLESTRRTLLVDTNPSGAKARLIEGINRLADRLRAGEDWQPWPISYC
jgi:polynucleotide 5'-kinase involved in rRNA processing